MVREMMIEQGAEKRVRLVSGRLISTKRIYCRTSDDTAAAFRRFMNDTKYAEEHVFAVMLTASLEVTAIADLSKGAINVSLMPVRNIFQCALLCNAAYVILVHNHPSGDCTPSKADFAATKRVLEAAKCVEIPVLDHIVMGDVCYWSFNAQQRKPILEYAEAG